MLSFAIPAVLLLPVALVDAQQSKLLIPSLAGFKDPSGVMRTFVQDGGIDLTGPFFQSLGTNGRSCGTCHQPSDAMSVSAAHIQERFGQTQGLDPIFRTNDGSSCDHDVDVSTPAARSAAYSLLRTRGLVALTVPADRDFEVVSVTNPYGCNERDSLSMYRRALPTTSLKFLSTVMWDGRESSTQTGTTPIDSSNYPQSLVSNLAHQAVDATAGHAQAPLPGLTAEQQQAIVAFEMGLFSAQAQLSVQVQSQDAGSLSAGGATGGPEALRQQPFFIGINDPVGLDPTNPVPLNFDTRVFNLFNSWQDVNNPARRSIARGQAIFNTKTFTISRVAGLNGNTFPNGVTAPEVIVSTCGICHDAPNLGHHSVSAPLDIGVADPPGGSNPLATGYLPTVRICQKPGLTTCVQTTDPGRAMVTGKFTDIGKFKGPILRGLAARAPYFHNGSAQTLEDVVTFYDVRFNIGLTAQEKADLVAFLNSL